MLHDLAILFVGIAGAGITWLAVVLLAQPRGNAGEYLEPGG